MRRRAEPAPSGLSSSLSRYCGKEIRDIDGDGVAFLFFFLPTISCYQIARGGSLNACLSEKHNDKSRIPHKSIHPPAALTCQAYIMGKQNLFPFFFTPPFKAVSRY